MGDCWRIVWEQLCLMVLVILTLLVGPLPHNFLPLAVGGQEMAEALVPDILKLLVSTY